MQAKHFLFRVSAVLSMTSWSFASAQPAQGHHISRGAIPPQNLQELVTVQHQITQVSGTMLRGVANLSAPKPACSAIMKRFDWRDYKDVTPVQDQESCGDCWAFASIAAYESSYLIENSSKVANASVPGAAEQQALDCSFTAYNCNGGWHDKVFDYFVNAGETQRSVYPYAAVKAQCRQSVARQYTAIQWDYVQGANIPSDVLLKTAICTHGPIVAAVDSSGWDTLLPNGQFSYSISNPDWKTSFPGGVVQSKPSNPALSIPGNLLPGEIDHDILIIGWDAYGWIVKNSWSKSWGDNGFGKIAFNHANIGFNAAWIQANRTQAKLSRSVTGALSSINSNFKSRFVNETFEFLKDKKEQALQPILHPESHM